MTNKELVKKAKKMMWRAINSDEWTAYCALTEAKDWSYTDQDPSHIRDAMRIKMDTQVRWFYPPWWKWWMRRVPAYVIRAKYPYTIFLNSRRRWEIPYLSGVLAHEMSHLKKYGHGPNIAAGKRYFNSVPARVQYFVEEWVKEQS